MMGAMTILEGTIDAACLNYPSMWVNIFRVATFAGMTSEGVRRGTDVVRREIVEEQYQEVADELLKLQQIICTVSDFQEQKEAE